jgi:hypothetical protein
MMSLQRVRNLISAGDLFYTIGTSSSDLALVVKARCREDGCNKRTVRFVESGDVDVSRSYLDRLARCPDPDLSA